MDIKHFEHLFPLNVKGKMRVFLQQFSEPAGTETADLVSGTFSQLIREAVGCDIKRHSFFNGNCVIGETEAQIGAFVTDTLPVAFDDMNFISVSIKQRQFRGRKGQSQRPGVT